MTATEILQAIELRGGRVRRDGEQLRLRIAKGALTDELRDALTAHRDELLALVTTYPCTSCRQFHFRDPGVTCFWCRRRTSDPLPSPQ